MCLLLFAEYSRISRKSGKRQGNRPRFCISQWEPANPKQVPWKRNAADTSMGSINEANPGLKHNHNARLADSLAHDPLIQRWEMALQGTYEILATISQSIYQTERLLEEVSRRDLELAKTMGEARLPRPVSWTR
jgi:hypothetical protein